MKGFRSCSTGPGVIQAVSPLEAEVGEARRRRLQGTKGTLVASRERAIEGLRAGGPS